MNAWNHITEYLSGVPVGVWIAVAVANMLLTAVTWSTARARLRRAGHRAANPDLVAAEGLQRRVKDTALTIASLVPAGLFWTMVLAGSFHGLVAFGRDTLGWHNGWEYLVPGTLDGVSVTFALLAFRAIRRGTAPDRCYRVVWGAAAASATINFGHEYAESANVLAGGYVGLLSLFGMVMFDEFLNQFEQGAATVRRDNPKFGIRWITWPTNTWCAAIAWRNHPPADGTAGTVLNAVANLERVRAAKRTARQERRVTSPVSPPTLAVGDWATPSPASGNGHRPVPAGSPMTTAVTRPRVGSRRRTAPRGRRTPGDGVKVPMTATTLQDWAATWVRMCTDTELINGPLSDDLHARAVFGLSARQLRHIRHAVTTGALRRQAEHLSIDLPDGYRDGFPDQEGAGQDRNATAVGTAGR